MVNKATAAFLETGLVVLVALSVSAGALLALLFVLLGYLAKRAQGIDARPIYEYGSVASIQSPATAPQDGNNDEGRGDADLKGATSIRSRPSRASRVSAEPVCLSLEALCCNSSNLLQDKIQQVTLQPQQPSQAISESSCRNTKSLGVTSKLSNLISGPTGRTPSEWTLSPSGQWMQYLPARSNVSELALSESSMDGLSPLSPAQTRLQLCHVGLPGANLSERQGLLLLLRFAETSSGAALPQACHAAVQGCAHPVPVLCHTAQYQLGLHILQLSHQQPRTVQHCKVRLVSTSGKGISLELTQAHSSLTHTSWQATTTWGPEVLGLRRAAATEAAALASVDFQVNLSCRADDSSAASQHLWAGTALEMLHVDRSSLPSIKRWHMQEAWQQAAQALGEHVLPLDLQDSDAGLPLLLLDPQN